MVERPMVFTLADLKRFPAVSRVHFLECSGNFGGRGADDRLTPQQIAGLTSTANGPACRSRRCSAKSARSRRRRGSSPKGRTPRCSRAASRCRRRDDDALIAYGQNGEAIRPEQGYPARLFLPGWEGNASVKWLRRIELSDQPFMTREETSKYTDPMADGTARVFSFLMDARSLITSPAYPVTLDRGWVEINGIAWTGCGKIRRVDVSTDGGATWTPAKLQEPVLPKAHTRFRYAVELDGRRSGDHEPRRRRDRLHAAGDVGAASSARPADTAITSIRSPAGTIAADGRVRFGLQRMRA